MASFRNCFVLLVVLTSIRSALSQSPYIPDVSKVGLPENGVFSGGSIDTIQLNNGNLHVDIPLLHLPGIGSDTDIHLIYDNMVWNAQWGTYPANTSAEWEVVTMSRPLWQIKQPMSGTMKWGWHPVSWECNSAQYPGGPSSGNAVFIDSMSFIDQDGTAHAFPVQGYVVDATYSSPPGPCVYSNEKNAPLPTSTYSKDSAGYHLVLNYAGGIVSMTDKHGTNYVFNVTDLMAPSAPVSTTGTAFPPTLPSGNAVNLSNLGTAMPVNTYTSTVYISSASATAVRDANGNQLTCCTGGTWNNGTYSWTFTDTANHAISLTNPANGAGMVPGVMTEGGNPPVQTISYTDQAGVSQSINITYTAVPISVCSGFNNSNTCGPAPGAQGATVTAYLPHTITLQDNQSAYVINYIQNGLGEISSITLPTGASISYTWGPNAALGAFNGNSVLSRTVSGAGPTSAWGYAYSANTQWVTKNGSSWLDPLLITTVSDPYGNDTVFTCTQLLPTMGAGPAQNQPQTCYMTNEAMYGGSSLSGGTPLVTRSTTYTNYGCSWFPTSEISTWVQTGQTTESDSTYDATSLPAGYVNGCPTALSTQAPNHTCGNIKSRQVYNYGNGVHGSLIDNTQYTYLHEGSSTYANANIVDRVAQVSVYNSATLNSSTLVAQTNTQYDTFTYANQSGLIAAGWSTNHNSSFGAGTTLRGLPTSVTKGVGSNVVTTYSNYNILGQPTAAQDGKGFVTTLTYGVGTPPSGQGNDLLIATTLPSTVTNGTTVQHITKQYIDPNTGLMMAKLGQNGELTTDTYDSLMRVLTETRPIGGGSTANSYPTPNTMISTVTEDGNGRAATTTTTLDGLGRKVSSGMTSDAACGPLTVDTYYDELGRVQSVSNPHCSSPQVTDGYTSFIYDALGRLTQKQNPDNSSQVWSFSGSTVDAYDETNRHWQRQYDAVGRLIKVLEPDGSASITNAPTMETDYTYDALNNLIQADQWGGAVNSGNDHQRKFAYDSLSRLIASNNPESASATLPAAQSCSGTTSGTLWTTCYLYDGNSNLTSKKDNRGITITYSYDSLNRLLSKQYTDATPAAAFAYDVSSVTGNSNDIGQLTQAAVTAGSTILAQQNSYSYDQMGRLLGEQQCTPATTACGTSPYQLAYTYDYAGKPTSGQFPSNVGATGQALSLIYAYDNAERLLTASSNWYAGTDRTHPQTLFQASSNSSYPAYGPMGLQNAALGVNPQNSTTTATMQRGYDDRGRLIEGVYGAGAGAITESSSSGSITISGSEGQMTTASTHSTAVLGKTAALTNAGGTHQSCTTVNTCEPSPSQCQYTVPITTCTSVPNTGSLTVTVTANQPYAVSYTWGANDTNASVMRGLTNQLNASGSPVTAVLNSDYSITLTSKAVGITADMPVVIAETPNQN